MQHTRRTTQGFTLVELSIVLVIIGLIVGGILAGQVMIRNTELKTILTDFNKYRGASEQFKNQYQALPGDVMDATEYWGAAHATPATCVTTVGTGTQTCNGNGDNVIGISAGSNELYRFWQHLANAGLIEGTFNGVSATGSYESTRLNSPVGKLASSMWYAPNWTAASSDPTLYDGNYGNALAFGRAAAGSWPSNTLLKAEEAWSIDTKIDDGRPGVGSVRGLGWDNCSNAATSSVADAATATYVLSDSNINCILAFAFAIQ